MRVYRSNENRKTIFAAMVVVLFTPCTAYAEDYRIVKITPPGAIVYRLDDRAKYRVIDGDLIDDLSALYIDGNAVAVQLQDLGKNRRLTVTRATIPKDHRSWSQKRLAALRDLLAVQFRGGTSQGQLDGCSLDAGGDPGTIPLLEGEIVQRLLRNNARMALPMINLAGTPLEIQLSGPDGTSVGHDVVNDGIWRPNIEKLKPGSYRLTVAMAGRDPKYYRFSVVEPGLNPVPAASDNPLLAAVALSESSGGVWRAQAYREVLSVPVGEERNALLKLMSTGATLSEFEQSGCEP